MRIEVKYYKKFNEEWAEVTKIFYDEKLFIEFLEKDDRYKYSLFVKRDAK